MLSSNTFEDATMPAMRALASVYGPRKGRVLGLIAEIHLALGDRAQARKYYSAAHALYAALEGARWAKIAEHYRKKMDQ